MADTLQFLFDFSQVNAATHETRDIGDGRTIHLSFVKSNDKALFFRRQGIWLLDVGILKFKFGVISVEGLIQVVHSFQSHLLLDYVNHKYMFPAPICQPFQFICFLTGVLKKALNSCQPKQ
jgi:hypothetical protein